MRSYESMIILIFALLTGYSLATPLLASAPVLGADKPIANSDHHHHEFASVTPISFHNGRSAASVATKVTLARRHAYPNPAPPADIPASFIAPIIERQADFFAALRVYTSERDPNTLTSDLQAVVPNLSREQARQTAEHAVYVMQELENAAGGNLGKYIRNLGNREPLDTFLASLDLDELQAELDQLVYLAKRNAGNGDEPYNTIQQYASNQSLIMAFVQVHGGMTDEDELDEYYRSTNPILSQLDKAGYTGAYVLALYEPQTDPPPLDVRLRNWLRRVFNRKSQGGEGNDGE